MKNKVKIILPFLFFLLLFGCNLNNTPTSKVEEKLSNYQMLDKSINDNIENGVLILSNNIESSNTEIERYRALVKKQYRNMVYEVKEEKIDGDMAVITVEIEVLDYTDIFNNTDDNLSVTERLNLLEEVKDTITYTLDFYVIKDSNGDWKLDNFSDEVNYKILGIY